MTWTNIETELPPADLPADSPILIWSAPGEGETEPPVVQFLTSAQTVRWLVLQKEPTRRVWWLIPTDPEKCKRAAR